PTFSEIGIERVNLKQKLEDNQVMNSNVLRVQERGGLGLDCSHHARPARVCKLLVKQILRIEGFISHQELEQILHLVVSGHQKLFSSLCLEEAGKALFLHFLDSGEKTLVSDWKAPYRDPLIEKAAQDSEQKRVNHQV